MALDCSYQWHIQIQDGLTFRKLKDDLAKPSGGTVLVGRAESNQPVILRPEDATHNAHFTTSTATPGGTESGADVLSWIIRLAPGIDVAPLGDTTLQISVPPDSGNHIVAYKMLATGETAFVVTPVVPGNARQAIRDEDLEEI